MRSFELVTGVRQVTCPWQAMRDPFVIRVLTAHKHWKQGSLHALSQPAAVVWGVEVYDSALNGVLAHDAEERMREQEREREQRRTPGSFGAKRPRPPRRGPRR